MIRAVLVLAALLVVTPAGAGDYGLYICGTTNVLFSLPSKGQARFYSYQRKSRYDPFTNQKEIPRRLFQLKGDDLYYRGKLCSEDDGET